MFKYDLIWKLPPLNFLSFHVSLKLKCRAESWVTGLQNMYQIPHRLNWKCWKYLLWCMMLLSNIYNKKCFKLKIIISFDTNCHYKLFTKLFVTFKLHILFNFSKNVSSLDVCSQYDVFFFISEVWARLMGEGLTKNLLDIAWIVLFRCCSLNTIQLVPLLPPLTIHHITLSTMI